MVLLGVLRVYCDEPAMKPVALASLTDLSTSQPLTFALCKLQIAGYPANVVFDTAASDKVCEYAVALSVWV